MLKKKEIRIIFANRARGQAHSIEELFATVSDALDDSIHPETLSARSPRANWRAILSNWIWAIRLPKADIVHVTGDIHYAVLGVWGRKVVLTVHDLRILEESRGLRRILCWLGWFALPVNRADAITVISEFTRKRLQACCRVNPNKVHVVPNCVAPEFVQTQRIWSADRPRVLLVGTTPNKNLDRVIVACKGLRLVLAILGRLDTEQKLLMESHAVEYEEYHTLSRTEVVTLYQDSDLVAFVSTYEGFGMPILEGQAVGRPILTSNISPMNEVAGEGAWKVDPFDVVSIREGLFRLISDTALRETLIQNGFRNVAEYSPKSISAKYAAVYREVMGRTPPLLKK